MGIIDDLINRAETRIRECGMYEGQERAIAEKIVSNPEFEHPPISQYSVISNPGIENREYCICGHIHEEGMV